MKTRTTIITTSTVYIRRSVQNLILISHRQAAAEHYFFSKSVRHSSVKRGRWIKIGDCFRKSLGETPVYIRLYPAQRHYIKLGNS
jgi:hypothetical protein